MPVEHTPLPDRSAIGGPYLERKLKPDGTWREYRCRLLHRSPGMVVVRFVMERGGTIHGTPISIEPGSVSHGYFWTRRPYNLYRMRRRDGSVIAHRFDALTDVQIGEQEVSYRDLVLDWWVQADGLIFEEDRDEFEDLQQQGRIDPRDVARALDASRQIWSRYRHIIDDVEAFERRERLPL